MDPKLNLQNKNSFEALSLLLLGPRICFSKFENVFQNAYFREMVDIESDRLRCVLSIRQNPKLQIRENRKSIRS